MPPPPLVVDVEVNDPSLTYGQTTIVRYRASQDASKQYYYSKGISGKIDAQFGLHANQGDIDEWIFTNELWKRLQEQGGSASADQLNKITKEIQRWWKATFAEDCPYK